MDWDIGPKHIEESQWVFYLSISTGQLLNNPIQYELYIAGSGLQVCYKKTVFLSVKIT